MDDNSERWLRTNLSLLQHKSVLIKLLDGNGKTIPDPEIKNSFRCATGFLTKEGNSSYLYTAWHVIVGTDPYEVKKINPPRIEKIAVYTQNAVNTGPGWTRIGGATEHIIELYETHAEQLKPKWLQDQQDRPDDYWNSCGIKIPFWHDAIKIRINLTSTMMDSITFKETDFINNYLLTPGDKVLIAGYPYGYSSMGRTQPTPIILTRFVAATQMEGRNRNFLIDGACFPVMSGSPVLIIRDNKLYLCGIYTGLRYPDYSKDGNEKKDKHAALGVCTDLSLAFGGYVAGWK